MRVSPLYIVGFQVSAYVCVRVYVHMCVCVYVCMCMCVCVFVCLPCIRISRCIMSASEFGPKESSVGTAFLIYLMTRLPQILKSQRASTFTTESRHREYFSNVSSANILKSQRTSVFATESRHREYFSECFKCQTFSKVSALVHLLMKARETVCVSECATFALPRMCWRVIHSVWVSGFGFRI